MTDKKTEEVCPKCGAPLGEVVETKSGKKLQRCSAGNWNPETRENEGCDYVKWLAVEPKALDEKCPKCGAPLMLVTTRMGKKMKKCSTATWDPKTKTAGGCNYVEWLKGTTQTLEEDCPKCGSKLVLFTTVSGKKLKKCSTSQWDPQQKMATGCDFVEWQNQ
ncbi:MAG: topoisomerase DNA-binding C4 zinc finger domain-containing protein [Patescibacteria group bacterium]